jgi:hypothetical protein
MNSRRFIANPAPDILNPNVSDFSVQIQGIGCPSGVNRYQIALPAPCPFSLR